MTDDDRYKSKVPRAPVVHDTPPPDGDAQRGSPPNWTAIVDAARKANGDWVRVNRIFAKAQAVQLASDFRQAHRRSVDQRLPGIRDGERWEAKWGEGGDVHGAYYVWIRHVSNSPR